MLEALEYLLLRIVIGAHMPKFQSIYLIKLFIELIRDFLSWVTCIFFIPFEILFNIIISKMIHRTIPIKTTLFARYHQISEYSYYKIIYYS